MENTRKRISGQSAGQEVNQDLLAPQYEVASQELHPATDGELFVHEDALAAQQGTLRSARERVIRFQEDYPYVATALETAVVWAGRQALRGVVSKSTGTQIGHGWQNTKFGQKFEAPPVALVTTLVAAPLAEEWVYRRLPSEKLNERNRTGPEGRIGAVMALGFAAGHAGKDALPVSQFIGGLNYWRLQRSRGYRSAVLAHATHNFLSLLGSAVTRRRKPTELH